MKKINKEFTEENALKSFQDLQLICDALMLTASEHHDPIYEYWCDLRMKSDLILSYFQDKKILQSENETKALWSELTDDSMMAKVNDTICVISHHTNGYKAYTVWNGLQFYRSRTFPLLKEIGDKITCTYSNIKDIKKEFVEDCVIQACKDADLIADLFISHPAPECVECYLYWSEIRSKAIRILSYFHKDEPEWLKDIDEDEIITDEVKAKELWNTITDDKLYQKVIDTVCLAREFIGKDAMKKLLKELEYYSRTHTESEGRLYYGKNCNN